MKVAMGLAVVFGLIFMQVIAIFKFPPKDSYVTQMIHALADSPHRLRTIPCYHLRTVRNLWISHLSCRSWTLGGMHIPCFGGHFNRTHRAVWTGGTYSKLTVTAFRNKAQNLRHIVICLLLSGRNSMLLWHRSRDLSHYCAIRLLLFRILLGVGVDRCFNRTTFRSCGPGPQTMKRFYNYASAILPNTFSVFAKNTVQERIRTFFKRFLCWEGSKFHDRSRFFDRLLYLDLSNRHNSLSVVCFNSSLSRTTQLIRERVVAQSETRLSYATRVKVPGSVRAQTNQALPPSHHT